MDCKDPRKVYQKSSTKQKLKDPIKYANKWMNECNINLTLK